MSDNSNEVQEIEGAEGLYVIQSVKITDKYLIGEDNIYRIDYKTNKIKDWRKV